MCCMHAGVLPAVQLHSWARASLYLGSFCGTSVLAMGAFAAAYGEATARLAASTSRLEWGLGLASALLSVAVGLLWVVLLALGKLQAVFGG